MVRILSKDDVAKVLAMRECIEVIDAAQRDFSAGEVVMPVRLTTRLDQRGTQLVMPAYLPTMEAFGVKCITIFPGNPDKGFETLLGFVALYDSATGAVRSIMEASHLTMVRTAAASAVATRTLARADASVLALVGAGKQARGHLAAMIEVRDIGEVRVVARRRDSADAFVAEAAARYPDVAFRAVDSTAEAIAGADIVCTVSSAREPVTRGEWITPGCHINGVGSHSPDAREIDGETMRRARVVVDSREANLTECGDCIIPIEHGLFGPEHVSDEIGEVLAGKQPGRSSDDEVTVYQSCGLAVQDVATASLVYSRAVVQGLGVEVAL